MVVLDVLLIKFKAILKKAYNLSRLERYGSNDAQGSAFFENEISYNGFFKSVNWMSKILRTNYDG